MTSKTAIAIASLPASSRLIVDAIQDHMTKTGCKQKAIAIDAGLEGNYLSMVKAGERPALSRIPGLKRAMPDLDDHLLTATVLCEQYPDAESQQAIIDLMQFFATPAGLEKEMLDLVAELRATDGAAGLTIPERLPEPVREQVLRLLKEVVQQETATQIPD